MVGSVEIFLGVFLGILPFPNFIPPTFFIVLFCELGSGHGTPRGGGLVPGDNGNMDRCLVMGGLSVGGLLRGFTEL